MGHNGHGINLYGVVTILMGNLHAGGQSNLGYLSLLHRQRFAQSFYDIPGGAISVITIVMS